MLVSGSVRESAQHFLVILRLSGLQRDASGHSVLWHAVAFGHWGSGAWIHRTQGMVCLPLD